MASNLSRKTVSILRAVKAAILAQPELYNQSRFPACECNTPSCIAGWGMWLQNPSPKAYSASMAESGLAKWASSFEMSEKQFLPLYVTHLEWPEPFAAKYKKAKNEVERAAVAADRIDYFIKTGGK
jgi:hypothetical protein